jgi:hypothetical protein
MPALRFMKRAPFILVWLLGVGAVVWAGFYPNPFAQLASNPPTPHSFPFSSVSVIAAFITIEVALLCAVIRPMSFQIKAWRRCTVAFAIAFAFLACGALGGMHAPPFMVAYIWWLLGVAVVLTLTLFSSITIRVSKMRMSRAPISS